VGIGIVNTSGKVGPMVVTQDFGSQNGEQSQLLGVAFDDNNHDNFYAPGEGRGDVTVRATLIDDVSGNPVANGPTQSVDTWASGGYQMPLAPGTYNVSASVGGKVFNTQNVTIGATNVEVDYNMTALSQPPANGSGGQTASSTSSAAQQISHPGANWSSSWKTSWVTYPAKQG
jgi:hypothetical protein